MDFFQVNRASINIEDLSFKFKVPESQRHQIEEALLELQQISTSNKIDAQSKMYILEVKMKELIYKDGYLISKGTIEDFRVYSHFEELNDEFFSSAIQYCVLLFIPFHCEISLELTEIS